MVSILEIHFKYKSSTLSLSYVLNNFIAHKGTAPIISGNYKKALSSRNSSRWLESRKKFLIPAITIGMIATL